MGTTDNIMTDLVMIKSPNCSHGDVMGSLWGVNLGFSADKSHIIHKLTLTEMLATNSVNRKRPNEVTGALKSSIYSSLIHSLLSKAFTEMNHRGRSPKETS